MSRSVMLLSGGVDSAALAFWKPPTLCLFVDYGQLSAHAEKAAASAIARALSLPLQMLTLDLASLGVGTMAGKPQSSAAKTPEWWPFRNQLLITVGAMAAARGGFEGVMIGTVAGDDAHRDGSAEFLQAIDRVTSMQEGRVSVSAPARHLTTAELIRAAAVPQEILAWTHSCHTGNLPCLTCRGCVKHRAVLAEVGYDR